MSETETIAPPPVDPQRLYGAIELDYAYNRETANWTERRRQLAEGIDQAIDNLCVANPDDVTLDPQTNTESLTVFAPNPNGSTAEINISRFTDQDGTRTTRFYAAEGGCVEVATGPRVESRLGWDVYGDLHMRDGYNPEPQDHPDDYISHFFAFFPLYLREARAEKPGLVAGAAQAIGRGALRKAVVMPELLPSGALESANTDLPVNPYELAGRIGRDYFRDYGKDKLDWVWRRAHVANVVKANLEVAFQRHAEYIEHARTPEGVDVELIKFFGNRADAENRWDNTNITRYRNSEGKWNYEMQFRGRDGSVEGLELEDAIQPGGWPQGMTVLQCIKNPYGEFFVPSKERTADDDVAFDGSQWAARIPNLYTQTPGATRLVKEVVGLATPSKRDNEDS